MEPHTLLVHPFGAPFVQSVADQLNAAGMLQGIVTGLSFSPSELARFPSKVGELLRRRAWLPEGSNCRRVIVPELIRIALMRSSLARLLQLNPQRLTDMVCEEVASRAGRCIASPEGAGVRCVYAFEDCALAPFQSCATKGIVKIYDLPIVHHRTLARIEASEAARYPEIEEGLFSLQDTAHKRAQKDEELHLASHVVVASHVTRRSLEENGYRGDVSVVPYGINPGALTNRVSQSNGRPLRVLFLGRVGPRKGVHRLLEVWRQLSMSGAELHLVGVNEFPDRYLQTHLLNAVYHGPASAKRVEEFLGACDLLVLPSLAEGFGLVMLEALARGVPVIATDATALPEILDCGECGVVVPAADNDALASGLERVLVDEQYRRHLAENAQAVASRFSWATHGTAIAAIVSQLVGGRAA